MAAPQTQTFTAEQLERIEAWATALESGEFEQCTGALYQDAGRFGPSHRTYCCLGVATELATRAGLKPEDAGECKKTDEDHVHDLWCVYSGGTLSKRVMEWYGFDSDDPELYLSDEEDSSVSYGTSAAEINDDNHTFLEIAYRVRRLFLGLELQEGRLDSLLPHDESEGEDPDDGE